MELSWSTFFLEIINFLVLVWILKRFLYKPVLDVIARRREDIEKRLNDAKLQHEDAEKLKNQYEGRLADWEKERQLARAQLSKEIEAERTNKMTELQAALDQETERARAADNHRRANERRHMEESSLQNATRFATRLLNQTAGPETEARLIVMLINELATLPPEQCVMIKDNYNKIPGQLLVTSAFPIPDDLRQQLKNALATLLSPAITIQYENNSELIAGVLITIGAWVLAANVRDELKGFVELARYA